MLRRWVMKRTRTRHTSMFCILRAEPDWYQFCSAIFVPNGQNNCMNNTFEVANVLLSEGITPSIPLYLATGLNGDQLASWRSASTVPFATQSLFKVYTLVTQEMLSEVIFNNWNPDCRHHKMFWPAISFLLGIEAAAFIGNSVSTFSGLLLQRRAQNKQRSIYYNGGGVWLQENRAIETKTEISTSNITITYQMDILHSSRERGCGITRVSRPQRSP